MTDPSRPSSSDASQEKAHTPQAHDDSSVKQAGETTGPTLPAAEMAGPLPDFGVLPCRFDRYLLEKQSGKGGMGTVYLAHDSVLDIPVAVKMPHPEVVRDPHALDR